MSILDEPLIAVAGIVGPTSSLTMFMHRGYDHPMVDIETLAVRYGSELEPGIVYLARGSRDNPLFAWPQYLIKRNLKHDN